MKTLAISAILAVSTFAGTTFAAAEGHATKQLVVRKGLCPQMIQQLANWTANRGEYTAFAVPTARSAGSCDAPGELVTAGIGSSPKLSDARNAALGVCNDNRGSLGRCVVIGTLRFKE